VYQVKKACFRENREKLSGQPTSRRSKGAARAMQGRAGRWRGLSAISVRIGGALAKPRRRWPEVLQIARGAPHRRSDGMQRADGGQRYHHGPGLGFVPGDYLFHFLQPVRNQSSAAFLLRFNNGAARFGETLLDPSRWSFLSGGYRLSESAPRTLWEAFLRKGPRARRLMPLIDPG